MKVVYAGRIPYREAWEKQRNICAQILNGSAQEQIMMVEHEPVYTLGIHGHASNMLLDEEALKAMGVECIRTERGGDITFHGPGQAVAYVMVNLRERKLGVKDFVHALEESVIQTLRLYGIEGHRVEGATGVWLEPGTGRERKICAIGIKVRHGVTYHGLALNVNTDLSWFRKINPCGFVSKGVTSVSNETGVDEDFGKLQRHLARALERNLAH